MNNSLIKTVIKKHCPAAKRFELYKSAVIYTDSNGQQFVAKENTNNILETYNYLNSRGFGYIPRLVYCDNNGYICEYEDNVRSPDEQKMSDLVQLDALLHNKTAYYKEISLDEIKEIYERLNNKILNTFNYYDDIVTMIENKIYMSPSEYLLARNCTSIFSCLNFCKKELTDWYDIVSLKNKKREVLLHNNLDVSHILRNKENILISWDKSVRELPIYDFIKLYKKNYNKYDFIALLKEYEKKFPLLDEEKKLMYVILFIPEKIVFKESEFDSTLEVGRLCNYLFTTDKLFMENETKNTEKQNNNINKEQEHLKSNA